MGVLVLVAVVAAAVAALQAQGRRQRAARLAAAATVRFQVDAEGVQRDLADGRREAVRWDELREVRAVVLPKGPWGERFRIILDGGDDRGCIVPRDVAEDRGLLAELGRLPGFDVQRLAEALDVERAGSTVLWRRPTRT